MKIWRKRMTQWINEWISDEAVYRTAPATPGLLMNPQLYGCSRQCSRPVLGLCSMGFGPNPQINGLIQLTFKLSILFFRKIHSNTFWLDKTFIFSSQVTMLFQIFFFFWKQKNQTEIFNWGLSCQARQAKKQVALEKSLRLHTRGGPAAAAEWVY